jgi:hypothetical protein
MMKTNLGTTTTPGRRDDEGATTVGRMVRAAVAAAALLLAAAGGQDAPAGTEEVKLQEELKDVLKKLREERSAFHQRSRSRDEEIDVVKGSLKRLEPDLAELRSREREEDAQIAEVRAEIEKMTSEEGRDRMRGVVGSEMKTLLEEGRAFVGEAPPYRKEDRLLRLGAATEGSMSDQLGRYWSFFQEEMRVARSGESYSAEVPLAGGRMKPARIFRVGHLVLGYVTEDGEESGLWDGKAWTAARTPEEDRSIRAAVDTLDRRRAPALLSLPVLRKVGP